jgi:fumarate hydratase subunit beta
MQIELHTPIADEEILNLKVGDTVYLSGNVVTGRDAAHKWLVDNFLNPSGQPTTEDKAVFELLKPILKRGLIYDCGPVVAGLDTKQYKFVAAGPTTSIREEPYQADVMRLFNLKGVIGKGGMGKKTLEGCAEIPAVYFHAIGGAAALIAQTVKEVVGVYKLEFGVPEAMWVVTVDRLPVVVTMDAHHSSLHESVREASKITLEQLINQ